MHYRNTFRFCFSSPRPPGGVRPQAYVHALPEHVPVLLFFASAAGGSPASSLRACMVALTRSFRRTTDRFCFSSPRPPGGARPQQAYVHAWLHLRVFFAGTRAGFAFLRLGPDAQAWTRTRGIRYSPGFIDGATVLRYEAPIPPPDDTRPSTTSADRRRMTPCTATRFPPPVRLGDPEHLPRSHTLPPPSGPTETTGGTYAFFSPARVPVLLFFASARMPRRGHERAEFGIRPVSLMVRLCSVTRPRSHRRMTLGLRQLQPTAAG